MPNIAVIGAILFTLLGGLYAYERKLNSDLSEANGSLKSAVAGYQIEKEMNLRLQKANRDLLEQNFKHKMENQNEAATRRANILQDSLNSRKKAQENPNQYGDDVAVKLAQLMCFAEASTDTSKFNTCLHAPSEAFTSENNLTVTITSEIMQGWIDNCSLYKSGDIRYKGLSDFCDITVISISPERFDTVIKTWAVNVIEGIKERDSYIQSLQELMKKVSNMEIEKGK